MSPESASQRPGLSRQATAAVQETSPAELEALADEVGRVPPLRPGEQSLLIDRIRRGSDEPAVARLLETHLGAVLEIAPSKKGRGLSIADLFQEGSVGLLAAIRAFPDAGEVDFEDFIAGQSALAMEEAITAEIAAAEQEQRLMDAAGDYDRVEMALAGELQRAPTVAEIGARLEWTPARTEEMREIVEEARRLHDDELLQYVDPEDLTDLMGGSEFEPN